MDPKHKQRLIRWHWILSTQFGLDPLLLARGVQRLIPYLRERAKFRRDFQGEMDVMPCLHDRDMDAGSVKSEYFWQDLLVAQWVHEAAPHRHIDIGSRLDGFVAHVACYREIEVFDIRPLPVHIPGVVFVQQDIMVQSRGIEAICDSLSCLHALEHFGLGRYGDPLNPTGYQEGFKQMARMLKPGGTFYLSVPVGRERVVFNANWILSPKSLILLADGFGMRLKRFVSYCAGSTQEHVDIDSGIDSVMNLDYALGIFVFEKPAT